MAQPQQQQQQQHLAGDLNTVNYGAIKPEEKPLLAPVPENAPVPAPTEK